MTIFEKAESLKTKQETKRFCINLFNQGKDWIDLETILNVVNNPFVSLVYDWYEDWQTE